MVLLRRALRANTPSPALLPMASSSSVPNDTLPGEEHLLAFTLSADKGAVHVMAVILWVEVVSCCLLSYGKGRVFFFLLCFVFQFHISFFTFNASYLDNKLRGHLGRS